MPVVITYDDEAQATGTHKGASGGMTVTDPGKHFKSCGIVAGLAVENDTDSSGGAITAVTEDTFTCTLTGGSNNTWTNGDTYSIYKTTTKDSEISRIHTDRRFGRKVLQHSELNRHGHFHDDEDLDIDNRRVFGPGQPRKS